MGLAAAREMFGAVSCVVEDLEFQKFLLVEEKGGRPVQVAVDPSASDFAVYARYDTPDVPGTCTRAATCGGRTGPRPLRCRSRTSAAVASRRSIATSSTGSSPAWGSNRAREVAACDLGGGNLSSLSLRLRNFCTVGFFAVLC